MKKIICFALVLLMLFGMSSCFLKKDGSIEFAGMSEASRITSIVTYTDDNGTLTSEYVTEIDRESQLALFSYRIQRYAALGESSDSRVVTDKGTIHYNMAADEMTPDGGVTWISADDAIDFKLKLNPEQFKTYEPFDDGNSAVATLAPSQTESVLGSNIDTKDNSDIKVPFISNGTFVYNVNIEYVAVSGGKVVTETSYNYEKITLVFSSLESAN